jgi:2-dehydropantoate 2-reductase
MVETPPDIQAAFWAKLVFIAAVSGAGAAARATIGEIRQCPPARQLLLQLMEEVLRVASAQDIRLKEGIITRTLGFVESLPASGTAPMQRDIVDGEPFELDEIIGVVVRLGDQTGVPTPTMDCVYASLLPQELRVRGIQGAVTVPSFDSSGPGITGDAPDQEREAVVFSG